MDEVIASILESEVKTVEKIKKTGKTGPIMYLVGKCMKILKGQGDAQYLQTKIKELLK